MSKYSCVRIWFYLFVLSHTQTNKTDASSITDYGNIERCRCSHPAHLRPPSSLCVKNIRSSKISVPEDSDVPHLPPGVVCRPRCLLAPNYPPLVTSWPRPQPGDPANGLTSGHQHQSLELTIIVTGTWNSPPENAEYDVTFVTKYFAFVTYLI